jgi:hypothetical protein
MLYREDLFVRLAELNDAEQRLYVVYIALAPFKDTLDRKAGVVDVTYKQLLAQPLKTWSKGKISRTLARLIKKGFLSKIDKRLILVNHYPLYKAKMKEMKLIFLIMKPGIPLTEQDVLLAKQKPLMELKQASKDLAQKFTIS